MIVCYNAIVTFNFLNSSVNTIEFRGINNLEQVVLRYSTDFRPMRMCVFQSILLCEANNGNERIVKWFDCSTSPPKPATDVSITHTHTNKNSKECCPSHNIFYMCIVNSGAKQLLVTVIKSGVCSFSKNFREFSSIRGNPKNVLVCKLIPTVKNYPNRARTCFVLANYIGVGIHKIK